MNSGRKQRARRPARAHHYLPVFYLSGFTLAGNRDDWLWVRDWQRRVTWRTKPENAGHRRDFNRIDCAGVEPDVIEVILAKIESQVAPVLREVSANRKLPLGEEFSTLLYFVALQATRVPQFRSFFGEKIADMAKHRARIALSDPRYFVQFVEEMKRQGKEKPASVSRESLLAFVNDESRYTVEVPREVSIHNMFDMAQTLMPLLDSRSWSLLVAQEENADFVCSDQPVLLRSKPPAPPFVSFGTADEIVIPLDRRTVLVGRLNGKSRVVEADRLRVGYLNKVMSENTDGFIYSGNKEVTGLTGC
jgi:hypothetical protein